MELGVQPRLRRRHRGLVSASCGRRVVRSWPLSRSAPSRAAAPGDGGRGPDAAAPRPSEVAASRRARSGGRRAHCGPRRSPAPCPATRLHPSHRLLRRPRLPVVASRPGGRFHAHPPAPRPSGPGVARCPLAGCRWRRDLRLRSTHDARLLASGTFTSLPVPRTLAGIWHNPGHPLSPASGSGALNPRGRPPRDRCHLSPGLRAREAPGLSSQPWLSERGEGVGHRRGARGEAGERAALPRAAPAGILLGRLRRAAAGAAAPGSQPPPRGRFRFRFRFSFRLWHTGNGDFLGWPLLEQSS